MQVLEFYCPDCDEEWDIPAQEVRNPRDTCIDCGAALDIERTEVA